MKQLEDALDNCIDNSGTYRLLDFRRRYTECGNMVLAVRKYSCRGSTRAIIRCRCKTAMYSRARY